MEEKQNKQFIFDLNAICDFVFNDNDIKNRLEITEVYDNDNNLVNKQIAEVKGEKNDANTAIRYDLLKGFIGLVCDIENNSVVTEGQKLAFNTLVSHNILKLF